MLLQSGLNDMQIAEYTGIHPRTMILFMRPISNGFFGELLDGHEFLTILPVQGSASPNQGPNQEDVI